MFCDKIIKMLKTNQEHHLNCFIPKTIFIFFKIFINKNLIQIIKVGEING